MRIKRLAVSGFRGINALREFDFDADVVILVGANGRGKTSVFDAVLWGLTGLVPRLGSTSSDVVSLFSPDGMARVEVELAVDDGTTATVTRTTTGSDSRVALAVRGSVSQGQVAEGRLLELLWSRGATTRNEMASFAGVLTRASYLQQDLVRQFLDADSDEQRFALIGELVGAGRLGEIQIELERTKAAWTRATNTLSDELAAVESRRQSLEDLLQRTEIGSDGEVSKTTSEWTNWWTRTCALLPELTTPLDPAEPDAAQLLDQALRGLQGLARERARRREIAAQLLVEIEHGLSSQPATPPASIEDIASVQSSIRDLEATIAEAAAAAQAEEETRARSESVRRDLELLAKLALRHLEDLCPVCQQTYPDRAAVTKRLESLAAAVPGDVTAFVAADRLAELQLERRALTARLNQARAERAAADAEERAQQLRREDQAKRLSALDVRARSPEDATQQLRDLISSLELNDDLSELQDEGESISLSLARLSDASRSAEISADLIEAGSRARTLASEIEARARTGDLAAHVIAALRTASEDYVATQLSSVEPLLQRLFARVDPHPTFRKVGFLARTFRGRGRMTTTLADTQGIETDRPSVHLSSSQLNVLAVAIFLSLNLGFSAIPLQSILLDDPLQSLDDVNLLGLVDVFRRTSDRRQIIVSTHDVRFAGLLSRKLRPQPGQRTLVYEFVSWDRTGPEIRGREVESDRRPLLLAAI